MKVRNCLVKTHGNTYPLEQIYGKEDFQSVNKSVNHCQWVFSFMTAFYFNLHSCTFRLTLSD